METSPSWAAITLTVAVFCLAENIHAQGNPPLDAPFQYPTPTPTQTPIENQVVNILRESGKTIWIEGRTLPVTIVQKNGPLWTTSTGETLNVINQRHPSSDTINAPEPRLPVSNIEAGYDLSKRNPDGSWMVKSNGSFYNAKAPQKPDVLTEQRIPDRTAERNAKMEEARKLKAAKDKSMFDVTRCYPQSLEKGNPLNLKVVELWKKLVEQKNSIINDPDAAFIVYSMAAETLGVKPLMPR